MNHPLVELKDVHKRYAMGGQAEVHALRGVSFSIHAGEEVAIMGPSGSGKSTCMHLIGCLDRPSSGLVRINGADIAELNEDELAHLRNRTIGFVFQQFHLLPRMTILDNVMLPLMYAGLDRRSRRDRAEEVLVQVGLSDRLKHRPTELSGGQRQRVAIARALAGKPGVILADEPTGALDSNTGDMVLELFKDIRRAGTTVIVVTHDPGVGERMERLIRVKDGGILDDTGANHVA